VTKKNNTSLQKEYENLYKTILEEHRQVFESQNLEELAGFINLIKKHNRIFILGGGREGIAARGFAMRLMHLGKEVHWIWDDTVPGMGKGDLFITVNGGGNVGHILYVTGEAKKTGARTAVITGSPSGAASALADFLLFVPASVYKGKDPVVPSIQPMGNLFEQHLFLLFDLLIMLLEKELKLSHDDMAARHRNIE